MRRRFAPIVISLLLASLSFAQSGGNGNGNNNGNNGGTPPPQNQTVPPKPKKDDTVEKIRDSLNGGPKSRPILEGFEPIGVVSARAASTVTFRAIARIRGQQVNYMMDGGPADAEFDNLSGDFRWTPTLPGTYSFDLIATGRADTTLSVRTRVTIVVTKPLVPYGYEFFLTPRATLRARLEAMSSLIGGSALNEAGIKNARAREMADRMGNPNNTNDSRNNNGNSNQNQGNNQNQNQNQNQASNQNQNQGNNQNQNQGNNPNQNQNQNQGSGNVNGNGDPGKGIGGNFTRPGYDRETDGFNNPNTASALRYLVGPFDMLGSNVFVPAPDRYQLGAGDTLELRYSSPTLAEEVVTLAVDAQGRITMPITGKPLVVRGQTLIQAENNIRKALSNAIREVRVTLSMRELRSMTITVIGDAYLPGSYQVPAVATLFNVLYMFGGPNDTGSLRRIELRRTDGSRRQFDLYRFLIFGDAKQDIPLQPGDTIFIPTVEARVSVDGEVGRPALYEVLPNDRLRDLISIAGGAKATGVLQRVSHTTVEPGVGLRLRDIDLKGTENPPVFGGDKIDISGVRQVLTNLVSIEGAVDQPGQYALEEKMTAGSLIARARGVIPGAYLTRADLLRINEDQTTSLISLNITRILAGDTAADVELKVYDRIRIYKFDEVAWLGDRKVTVDGAVRRPGIYPRADGMRIIDLLMQSGGLSGDAFMEQGFLQRVNADGTNGDLLKIDFRKVAVGDEAHNVLLMDRDLLTIQSTSEAKFVPDQQVRILGNVQRPGAYPAATNLTVSSLLQLAGGMLPGSTDTIEVSRARVKEGTPHETYKIADIMAGKDVTINPGDLVTVPSDGNFVANPRTVFITGAVAKPGPYSINGTTDRISDVLARAGGPTQDAFLNGAQYFRSPSKLQVISHVRLSPRIREVLNIVAEDEYTRAVARAEVEKARVTKSINQGQQSVSIPGLGAAPSNNSGPAVQIDIKGTPVSRARILDDQDVEPAGNLNVNLESALKRKKGKDDIVVMDGDIIVVPEKPSTVAVVGAVTVPSALLYEPGKNVQWYLDRSGGLMSDAQEKMILIFRANGQVIRAKKSTRVELGDRIFVPTKVMAERLTDRQADIDAISRNITNAALLFTIFRALGR